MPGEKIVGIRKDGLGKITQVKTNTGRVLPIYQAMLEAEQGGFDSLSSIDEDGNWYISDSVGNGEPIQGENLSILPEF